MNQFGVEEALLTRLCRAGARFKCLDALQIRRPFINPRGADWPRAYTEESSDCQ
jgi:hypothetical protein